MIKLEKNPIIVVSDPQGFEIINATTRRTIVLSLTQFMGTKYKYESAFYDSFEKLVPEEERNFSELIITPKAQEKVNALIEFNRIDS